MMDSILNNVREDEFYMGPLSAMDETYLETTVLQERFVNFRVHLDDNMDITTEDVLVYFKDPISSNGEITDFSISPEESITTKGGFYNFQPQSSFHVSSLNQTTSSFISTSDASLDVTSMPSIPPSSSASLILPAEGMEFDKELAVFHLLMAYAEAVEMGQEDLTEVIVKRISEKVSPVGDTLERLMYYMFHNSLERHSSDYLKQESVKNFYQAFRAFYQIFPHGKFAHFAANLAILETLPNDADMIIRIFDFDVGEGIQWASLIEAIGHQRREVRLTSVKFGEYEDSDASTLMWKFEDTKKRLCDYARTYGLKLKVDVMELVDLVDEMKNIINQKGLSYGRREFIVFNCMIGIPHMGRLRSRKDVFDFLELSQKFLQIQGQKYCATENRGIIVIGDGDAWEKVKNASNYGTYLDGNMAHYQTLLESIQLNFPSHLGEARTAMETLFVAPFVSSHAWAEKWEERKKYGHINELGFGLKGLKLSLESLLEAKEMVREGESLYGVRIEGDSYNEMVMDWRGIPMVRVSCWRS
ncbi:hypothetical protein ACH5RR_005183 [Cinchona calisaya]|uniref:Uncharacterized protein n=1 Tax=Cinchona calisaya TaxID=153742 RepID=A0ABD3AKF3_9GENT